MAGEFVIQRMVQFAETDLAGVLHFANYHRMMEEAEHAFWRSLGTSVMIRDGDGELSWPRVATSCDYFAPARFEDVLDLALRITEVGTRSLTYEVEFRRGGKLLARGRTTAVCCRDGGDRFRSVAIPIGLRKRLSEAMGGERRRRAIAGEPASPAKDAGRGSRRRPTRTVRRAASRID